MKYLPSPPQEGLLCFWDFHQPSGDPLTAQGMFPYVLEERDGTVPRAKEGLFGPHSASFGSGAWLELPRPQCPALNLSGKRSHLTLVAWVKRSAAPPVTDPEAWNGCQAVAGMWNEHGNRQYGLFLNLRFDGGEEQVGAHVSRHGGPTPPYPYCRDAAMGETQVPLEQWSCVAMTYDGRQACAWLDGKLDRSPGRNPFVYPGALHDGGPKGSNFTVGAVRRAGRMLAHEPVGDKVGNPFYGLMGGLAVYQRVLSGEEMRSLWPPLDKNSNTHAS